MKSSNIIATLFLALMGIIFASVLGVNPMIGAVALQFMHFVPMPSGVLGFSAITTKVIEEQRQVLHQEMVDLNEAAKKENRKFNEEEKQKWDEAKRKFDELANDLKEAKEREEVEEREARRKVGETEKKKEEKRLHSYSLTKAIRMAASGKLDGKEDGFYLEMHQEAEREARNANVPNGIVGFGVPSIILSEKRDLTATGTTSTSGDEGGDTVQTTVQGFIEPLKDALVVKQLGASVLTGLQSNISIPRGSSLATVAWEGETDDTAETSPLFDSVSLTPNRLAAFTEISKQLLLQSSIDVEKYVRELLMYAIAKGLETAAINGSGSSNQPTGILNVTGIGSVAGGTDGAAPDWADLVNLEKEVAIDNALGGKVGYLTNYKVAAKLKQTIIDSGSGRYIWPQGAKDVNGYPVGLTNIVPSTLVKGSSGAVCSAIIFGNFQDLIIGQWGGLDITVDDKSLAMAKAGKVAVVINSFWDVAVRHAESFAAMKDALTA